MSNPKMPSQEAALLGCAISVAPAAVGCALGVLLGEKMSRRSARATAFTLFTVALASAAPYVMDYVSKRMNGPGTARGQQRQRSIIRDGALPAESEFYEFEAFEKAS